ncbi:hypothetical protein RJ640_014711 [Escallonia rubra]|uniref:Uncharacterized protein n=1 Tax=Escallonia rubra TaxID=112253 RepID=A0AA88RID3_9ASTE|nr:hypothetical protein RJ640_014711 [Escallonia rubra]
MSGAGGDTSIPPEISGAKRHRFPELRGLCAGMYSGLTYGLKEARGVHDWKNSAVAGAITGAALALTSDESSHEQIVQCAITGAAISTAANLLAGSTLSPSLLSSCGVALGYATDCYIANVVAREDSIEFDIVAAICSAFPKFYGFQQHSLEDELDAISKSLCNDRSQPIRTALSCVSWYCFGYGFMNRAELTYHKLTMGVAKIGYWVLLEV